MATIKEIQDAIDNKTFDPSKLTPSQRRLVDEAIRRGAIKGPTTREITQQRKGAADAAREQAKQQVIGGIGQVGGAVSSYGEDMLANLP